MKQPSIQTGVAAGTFDPLRIAVVRGPVTTRDGAPLSGVALTILHHPEWGQTLSRADGWFDLAVNGGGNVTVQYQKDGYLPVQRTLFMPWNEFNVLENVVMTPLDANVSPIDLSANLPLQAASGSVVTDEDGTRRAVLLFPQGLQATMTLPDGSIQPLTQLDVRATEYTVGATGPQAMPADLPPQVGYTYAVEYSVDQALAAGATRVDFNQPVIAYVDNFLHFPTGTVVPAGWYDRQQAQWVSSPNGRVLTLLAINEGQAIIDVEGHGPATVAALTELGISPAELQYLAQVYTIGQSLWRVPVSHFSLWDYNWILIGPASIESPPPVTPTENGDHSPDHPDCQPGSVIECQSQVLQETLPLVGTPLTLHYSSDRVRGRKVARTLSFPLPTPRPAPLMVDLQIAGQVFHELIPATPAGGEYRFTWNGLDAYGRALPGAQVARFRLGYQYLGVYVLVSSGEDQSRLEQFGRRALRATTNVAPTRVGQVAPGGRWQGWQTVTLGPAMPTAVGVAGWTVSTTHTYSPVSHDLWLGNGQRRGHVPELRGTIQTVWPTNRGRSVAVDSQGRVYFQNSDYQLSRVTPTTGQVEVVAGTGQSGWNQPVVENVPATAVNLSWLSGIYLDANDYWYVVERLPNEQQRIRRVGPNGLIQTWAGGGTQLPSQSLEQLATQVVLPQGAVTVSATGEVYVAVSEGVWTTIYLVDATQRLHQVTTVPTYYQNYPSSLAVTPAGDLYLVLRSVNWGFSSLYRLTARGELVTVAHTALTDQARLDGIGKDSPTTSVEAVTATLAGELYFLYDTLYFQNYGYGPLNRKRVFRLEPDEQVITLAGGGDVSVGLGENGAATAANLGAWTNSLAITADGSVWLGETPNSPTSPTGRLRKIGPALPGSTWGEFQLADADGQALYHFTRDGRHLRTMDAMTGRDLYQFGYDEKGYLLRITDIDGDVTTIERDEQSVLTAILAPNGQRTRLTVNANGYLETVTNPAGETYRLAYTNDGLLTQFTTPRGHTTTMQYDSLGRLSKEENPVGGGWTLSRTQTGTDFESSLTSAEHRTSRYLVDLLNDRDLKRVHTAPDGTQSVETSWSNGTTLRTQADGTVISQQHGPDPRFECDLYLMSLSSWDIIGI